MSEEPRKILPETDNLFSSFINNTAGLVMIFDAGGKIVYCNNAFAEATGYSPDEIKGKLYWDIFLSADELELFKAFFENLDITDFPFTHENYLVTKEGENLLILWSYNAESADGETIDYVFCAGIDITERSRNEEALRKLGEDTSAIINALPMAVISFDKECRIKSWNSTAERLFGWKEKEVLGKFNIFFPESEKGQFRQWCDYVLTGKALTGIELRGQKKDGGFVDISLSQAPLRDADGTVIGMIAVIADITEKKRVECSIREKEEQLSLLTDNIMDIISFNTVDGICKFISPSVRDYLGYDTREMLGYSLFDFVHPDDLRGLMEDFQGVAASPFIIKKEIRMRHADNYYVLMEFIANPVYDNNNDLKGVVISSRAKS